MIVARASVSSAMPVVSARVWDDVIFALIAEARSDCPRSPDR